MHQHLTVRETIEFAAKLRLPKLLSEPLKQQRVDKTIADLGLRECRDTAVTQSFSFLSTNA
jgi:ABC-type multidrug transport system ATPase subunit